MQEAPPEAVAEAKHQLGMVYSNGDGVALDTRAAEELLMEAAAQGNMEASFDLGLMYQQGEHEFPVDKVRAAELYEQAAAAGQNQAQCNLGILLMKGDGIPEDTKRGQQLLQMSAQQGNECA